MTISNIDPYKKFKRECPYTGVEHEEITMEQLDAFLKNEIALAKNCGCPNCHYKKDMYRFMQYIIKDYTKLLAKENVAR